MFAYQLIYVPAEVIAAGLPVDERLGILGKSVLLGVVPSLIGSTAVLLASVATSDIASPDLLIGLTATSWVAVLVSPTQDHARRLLHFRGWSWDAATVSAVQLGTVIVAIVVMVLLDVSIAWIPFGALAIANVLSLTTALVIARLRRGFVHLQLVIRTRELLRTGWWLLLQGALPMASAFIAAWMITSLATPADLGYADAARVAAQPVLVLGMGLSAVLGPRAMEAALGHNRSRANKAIGAQVGIILVGGLLYLLMAAGPFPWNPMRVLVPKAYEIPGLVAATVVVNMLIASLFIVISELTAAGKVRLLAVASGLGGLAQIAVTLSAGTTGAFARPLGLAASNAVRVVGYSVGRAQFYEQADDPSTDQTSIA
jgi:O-antigen/teichoic acid export membrane protein